MEELLVVILQFLFETVLESLVYWPFESATDQMLGTRPAGPPRDRFVLVVAFIAGGVVGGISLVVWPYTWLQVPLLRIANLVIAPLLSAGSAWLIASHRTRPSHSSPREHAWFGLTFTLVFVLVRFTWAIR